MNPELIIQSGNLLASIPLALLAGLVSFLSPCILPLVPGYLGYVSGAARERSRVVLGASLFVLGFTLVFVVLGSVFGAAGVALRYTSVGLIVQQVLGALLIVFGFAMIGKVGFLQRSLKLDFSPRMGLLGAPLLGITFAIGWTACTGPTLAAVLSLSLDSASVWSGALLSACYSIGLGLPFILIAVGFRWATRSVDFVRRNIRKFNIAGGVLLMVLGALMVLGIWNQLMSLLQEVNSGFLPAI